MSDGVHWLVPFAAGLTQAAQAAAKTLCLPHLEKLLARMAPAGIDSGDEHTFSMPHERVLARAHGVDPLDGRIPWAAWQLARSGREPGSDAWAWLTPCHWDVHVDHVTMDVPEDLGLSAEESRQMLAAMQPYFEQDGIVLEFDAPARWLARGEPFRAIPTASLDRVSGRAIDTWMPRADEARVLRRLQQEMQMLLYTHPLNEERTQRGLAPVNSFWVSGAGAIDAGGGVSRASLGDRSRRNAGAFAPHAVRVQLANALRAPALHEDWTAWSAAWRELDTVEVPRLASLVDQAGPIAITLCGERRARTWTSEGAGWARRLASLVRRERAPDLLEPL
ncbi:MAG TPA: phosphoglycerate mutase [Ramlibacter sp.]|uniref:phosphoglycerate mutase n=1 Tax=Ramlibacter sp. TaxID=1917967 RepID=UPI002BCB2530|nr:phosphoglycerate mutase [Ramlibacter sp.]HVZ45290.1 phosphoglycerate mutase [Ramlibacter sp.]